MNNPHLYKKTNNMPRRDAEQILNEFSNKLQWRLDGGDTLLDVGSGSGDVLMDFIYTIMPENFEKIVCSDISPQMISYAKNVYQSYKKCDFKVLDICTEKELPKDLKEQFDHVTSFFCLHWIVNKRQAVRNIFNLLKAEGGDCLLVFFAVHPIFEAYKIISKTNKWSSYMQDVDRYTIPMDYTSDPGDEFYKILEEEGFSNIKLELRHKVFSYENEKTFKETFKAVNPFLERMHNSLHNSYMDDLTETFASFGYRQIHPSKDFDHIFEIPYQLIISYAQKL